MEMGYIKAKKEDYAIVSSMISLASFAFCKTLIEVAPNVGSPSAENPTFSSSTFWLGFDFLAESLNAGSEQAVSRIDLTDSIIG
jgi:hypothetical protein